ncbi:phosphonate ABC transporter, permease protein PhnE [bacterium]|nr:phosphonate ABC transporter, permease protein PhnE [bacterium]
MTSVVAQFSETFAFISKDWAALNMSSLFLGFGALVFLCAGLCLLFNSQGVATLGEYLFSNSSRKQEIAHQPFLKSFYGLHLLITFAGTFYLSAIATGASFYELTDPDGFAGAMNLFKGLINANFDLLPLAIIEVIETIFIAFLATVIAIPIAFVLSFLCAKNIMVHPVAFTFYATMRTLLNITRSVEPLIWAIIFSVWVGIGPFAGMLALLIHSIASLAKQYSEIVEGVSDGPIEGIRSTGANAVQTVWFAVVPQVVLPYIAFTIYRWDINVRMATIIGLVGGGGIGTLLIKYQGQGMWPEVGCIIIVIAAVVWLMDTSSAYIREALK